MDAVGALVNVVEPIVTVESLDRIVPRIAVASEHLDGELVRLEAELGGPGLGYRGQQFEQQVQPLPLDRVAAGRDVVHQARTVQDQPQPAFHPGLLREQHAAYVSVAQDRDLGCRGVTAGKGAALRPVAGILQRVEVSRVAQGHCAGTDADARLVHELEHVFQSAVFLADEFADAAVLAAEGEHRVDRAAPAHLVVEAHQAHVVRRAAVAGDGDPVARHDEQGNALHARRATGYLGQHEVDDVFSEVVFAAADPHLVAGDAVTAIAVALRAAADVTQRRSGLGFRQAHGAKEASLEQRPRVALPLCIAAEVEDHVGNPCGQHGIAVEADMCPGKQCAAGL